MQNVSASTTKGVKQKLTEDGYREHVAALKEDLRLDDETVSSLLGICDNPADRDAGGGDDGDGVLEELNPSPSVFGYVAATYVPNEGFDVVHIVSEASYDLNFSCFDWFTSARKK